MASGSSGRNRPERLKGRETDERYAKKQKGKQKQRQERKVYVWPMIASGKNNVLLSLQRSLFIQCCAIE